MGSARPDDAEDDRAADEDRALVERLVGEYIDRINQGDAVDPAEVISDHPELAARILTELETFQAIQPSGRPGAPLGVLGDYTLRRQVGRGGMGVVYEAWEGSMDRRVALKVLPPGIAADQKAFLRFMREAKTAGQLSHPNIVPVHAMGVKEQTPYYSMEYVEGETLARIARRMQAAGPESPTPFGASREELSFYSLVARAFADVADGLQHAHSRGVVHRDIKPSNLILETFAAPRSGAEGGVAGAGTGSGSGTSVEGTHAARLRILDFGLARLEGQESLSASGDVVGTPLYMSPEQARRRKVPVDHRTDVYSLGATLYEVLTLEPPFRGRDHEDTLSQIIGREPRPPRQWNPRVPRDLETIVLKCLRKEPGDRYGTAEALGQDLRRFVRGDPIEAREQSAWEKVAHRLWRRRRSLLGVAGMIALSLVGLSLSTFLVAGAYRSVRDERDVRTRELYRANMRLAMQDWEAGNYLRFTELIDRHVPRPGERDLRGWEWCYLETLRQTPKRITIEVDPGGVQSVAWSPDGQRVATGSADGIVRVWDASTGARVAAFPAAGAPVRATAWSPDGTRLAFVTQAGVLGVRDVSRGTEVYTVLPAAPLPPQTEQHSVLWSPDGRLLVSGSGQEGIDVRNGVDGSLVLELPGSVADSINTLAWSPDGAHLAAALRSRGEVAIWSANTWKEERRLAAGGRAFVYAVAWSPDGSLLATGSALHDIRLWKVGTWEEQPSLVGHTGHVYSLDWRPEGLASTGQDGVVTIWDSSSLRQTVRLLGHTRTVWQVAWSPTGDRLASAGQDGTAQIWEAAGDPVPVDREDVTGAWSADGRLLATVAADGRTLRVLEVPGWGERRFLPVPEGIRDVAFSPDGRLVSASTVLDCIVIWDWEAALERWRLEGQHAGPTWCIAWHPGGDLILTSGGPGRGGAAKVWSLASRSLVRELQADGSSVRAAAWSPDGRRLALTSEDLSLRIWESGTWRLLHDLRRGLRLSNSGYATSRDAIAWSPDGRLLATTVSQFPTVILWDVESGQEASRVAGHVSGLSSVAWSPDGTRLATGGFDRAVKVWDVSDVGDPVELIALRGHDWVVHTLTWHPGGRMLLSGDSVDGIRIWDASKGYER